MRGMSSEEGLDVENHSRFLQPVPEMVPFTFLSRLNIQRLNTFFLLLGDCVWDSNWQISGSI